MASSVIGNLRVNLGLDSASLQNGLRAAGGSMNKFAADMGRVAGAAAATLGPALAAIGVAAINSANDIQRLAQLSNATPEQFQEWAAASKTVGIEQDKLGDILKDVNDRVGDFVATGGGPMVDFFENIAPKVGVTADMFRDLSGPDALQLYIDSLQKAGVNQQDMTFYLEAMASDLTGLLPLLQNGGAGLDEYRKKARDLGVVMSNDTVASFAAAKRSMEGVSMAMTGFRNIIAAQVVPHIQMAADAFVNAAREGQPLGDFVRSFAEQIPRITSYITTFIGMIGVRWVAAFAATRIGTLSLAGALSTLRAAIMRTGIGAIVVGAGELVYQFSEAIRVTGNLKAAFFLMKAEFLSAINSMVGAFSDFTWAIADWSNQRFGTNFVGASSYITSELYASEVAAREMAASLSTATSDGTAGANRLATSFSGVGAAATGAADKAKGKISDLQRVMKDLADELARIKGTWGMSDIDASIWEKQREAGVTAQSANGQLIDQQMRQIDNMTELKDATDQWRDSIGGAMSEFITKGGSFKNVLASILTSLADIVISDAFNSMFRASGASGWASSILGAFGIGRNANGTNNWRGGLSWVNERGGELMNLPNGTQIIPHDISKRMADRAGSSISMTIDFTGDGNIRAIARDQAGRVMAEAAPAIQQSAVKQSVGAVRNLSGKSKSYFGGAL